MSMNKCCRQECHDNESRCQAIELVYTKPTQPCKNARGREDDTTAPKEGRSQTQRHAMMQQRDGGRDTC